MIHKRRWNPRNLVLCISTLVLTAIVINIFSFSSPTEASGNKLYKSVVVQNGDNLWNLAVTYVPNKDPRRVIESIKHVNNLTDENIIPGELLKVPTN